MACPTMLASLSALVMPPLIIPGSATDLNQNADDAIEEESDDEQ